MATRNLVKLEEFPGIVNSIKRLTEKFDLEYRAGSFYQTRNEEILFLDIKKRDSREIQDCHMFNEILLHRVRMFNIRTVVVNGIEY